MDLIRSLGTWQAKERPPGTGSWLEKFLGDSLGVDLGLENSQRAADFGLVQCLLKIWSIVGSYRHGSVVNESD